MFSVDFDTKKYHACYDRELLPSQIPEIFDISKILENIEQSEKEQNQESYAGKGANFTKMNLQLWKLVQLCIFTVFCWFSALYATW